jgi:hypothetical protein
LRIKSSLNYHTGDTPRSLSRSRTGSTASGHGVTDPMLPNNATNSSAGGAKASHLRVPGPSTLPPPSTSVAVAAAAATPALGSNGQPISGISSSSLFPPSPLIGGLDAPANGGATVISIGATPAAPTPLPYAATPTPTLTAPTGVNLSPGTTGVAGPSTARSVLHSSNGTSLVEIYHDLRSIFDSAQATSYALMESNSWNRFRTSGFFQTFLASFQGWTSGAVRKRSTGTGGGTGDDDDDDRSTTGGGVGNRWQMGHVAPSSKGQGVPAIHHSPQPSGGGGGVSAAVVAANNIRNSAGAAAAMAAFTSGIGGTAAASRVQAVVHAQSVIGSGVAHNSGSGSGGSGGHGTRGHQTHNNHTHGSVLSSGGPIFTDGGLISPTHSNNPSGGSNVGGSFNTAGGVNSTFHHHVINHGSDPRSPLPTTTTSLSNNTSSITQTTRRVITNAPPNANTNANNTIGGYSMAGSGGRSGIMLSRASSDGL